MGTVFSFAFGVPVDAEVRSTVQDELERIEGIFSTYRADSDISRLASGQLTMAECAPEVEEVHALCVEAAQVTYGYFDAWHTGTFDPTGLVKGWAVARAARLLDQAGSRRHVINGGGDVFAVAREGEPWRIGVTDGAGPELIAVVSADNAAVATSGNSERPGLVRDPYTGRPALALRSVSVIGADLTLADAFATAALAMGNRAISWLAGLSGYDAVVVSADGTVTTTPGAAALLTSAGRARLAPN